MNDKTKQALTDTLRLAARNAALAGINGWSNLCSDAADTIDNLRAQLAEAIDMVLHCPACGMQHIDAVEELPMPMPGSSFEGSAGWTNPPHRSHLCHGCSHIWRPADVPTNGVEAVKTCGKADSKLAAPTDTLRAQLAEAQAALKTVMRNAELSKEPCDPDPESPAAIRNGKFAGLASIAAQGLGMVRGPSLTEHLAEAQKDAERLDWLEDNWHRHVLEDWEDRFETLRAAIDAAKGKTP